MFIIWGFGKRTIRRYGKVGGAVCGHCNNTVQRELLKVTTWFTLFFIPIIPYRIERLLVCPICGITQRLSKNELEELAAEGLQSAAEMPTVASYYDSDEYKYAGKTPVQIEYLKQIEAFEAEKAKKEAENEHSREA